MNNERGRPRSFDKEEVLDRALEVFWRHGFQSTSMSELTAAMGLNKPSLYAAFGDKEQLYLLSLERYMKARLAKHAAILAAESDGRRAIERFLCSMADMVTDPELPGGCFVINGTADCGGPSMPPAVEMALRQALRGSESMLQQRLERAQRDGQLSSHESVQDLAAFFISLFAGLCVLAKSGAARAKLDTAITAAMRVWPERLGHPRTRAT